jgi:hypothetical protein
MHAHRLVKYGAAIFYEKMTGTGVAAATVGRMASELVNR